MKTRLRIFAVSVALASMWNVASQAEAVDPPDLFLQHLADFVWTGGGGNTTWENSANWTAPTFPGDYPYTIPTYPNDPGRLEDSSVQTNVTTIFPVVGANLSGAFGADRTVNIANGNVTVAALKLGGTGVAVTTNVTATAPHRLVFENYELNDTVTNPGNPNADPEILPEPIYSFNQGRSLIWSTGTAGVGKENRISADIQLNDGVDLEGDRDLHIYGNIYEGPIDRNTADSVEEIIESSINSLLSGGAKLYIHGNIHSVGVNAAGTVTSSDGPGGDRRLGINNSRGRLVPEDPQNPPDAVLRQGDVDITGSLLGNGFVSIGAFETVTGPPINVFLRGDSSTFTGRLEINRVNLVLDHDNATGAGLLKSGVGNSFVSSSDDRVISSEVRLAQWMTVRGASGIAGLEGVGDHSLEFSGIVAQSNTRGVINVLSGGKTLTFSGPVYPNKKSELPPGMGRVITFDGTGTTILAGGVHDQLVADDDPPGAEDKIGYLRTRGSGALVIDGRVFDSMGVQTGFNATDFSGFTFVDGGHLHFRGGQSDAFAGDDLPGGDIISRTGAVGVDEGVVSNSAFLNKLTNSSNPNKNPNDSPFFLAWGDNSPVFTTYSTGGLMLGTVGANEYTQNLDFNSGDLARAANMSLAAHEGGSTYTGTITPSSTVAVNPNTYQLGGGSGTLTLPNTNQLTGARGVLATNGGEVRLQGSNNYTGATRILRKHAVTMENDALGQPAGDGTVKTTLTATTLANGGAASSIGSSTNEASNLVIQGSTLKYVGGAATTDRLFTVGSGGATIDASGTGAVTFNNTGALAMAVPARRNGLLAPIVFGTPDVEVFGQPTHPTATRREFHTEDLTLGMRIYTSNGDFNPPSGGDPVVQGSPVRVTEIVNREVIRTGQPTKLSSESDNDASTQPNAWPGYTATAIRMIQFGPAPARFLTLTGENTGNNTLASLIANPAAADIDAAATSPEVAAAEAAAGYGTTGIRKTGAGKWILTGNNSYSWATNVEQGMLLINGNQTGAGLTTVSSGASFGGTGQIGGGLTMLEGSAFTAAFSGGTIDPLSVLGDIDLSALGNILNVTGTGVGSSWTLLTYAGTLMGTFESTPGFTVDYGTGSNSQITISAAAGGLTGDYNNDGKVDAADYTVWRDNLGASGATLGANRDPANMGVVSMADYSSWKANFGAMFGSGSLAGAAVPEPASLVLLSGALVGLGYARRRRGD